MFIPCFFGISTILVVMQDFATISISMVSQETPRPQRPTKITHPKGEVPQHIYKP
jgi:hypothetical protein